MKKVLSILTLVLVSISVLACGKKERGKVALLYGDTNATSFKDHEFSDTSEIQTKMTNKDNFLLFVYDDFCECSKAAEGVIDHVIDERDLLIYSINSNKLANFDSLKDLSSNAPALVLFKDGKIFNKTVYTGHEKYFENYAGFKSYLDKYTIEPVVYYINETQLDEKISNNETFVIYYDKANCPFCAYLKQHYLKEYMIEHPSNKYYAIDVYVEGIQLKNGSSTSDEAVAQFTAFKAKYKLSNLDGTNPYGFTKGWNPSMHSYKNGVLSGAFIQSNEKTSTKDEEGNTYYTITRSYYDDNPYVGQTLAYAIYNDTMASFYKTKLYEFMNGHFG